MGKNNKGRRRPKKKAARAAATQNFVPDAGIGCYIVREDNPGNIIEFETIDSRDYDGQEVPDVALDPDDKTLSLCNVDNTYKVAYITVYNTKCFGGDMTELQLGSTTSNDNETNSCLTFIVLCPPSMFVHLCVMDTDNVLDVKIESDVQEWSRHPAPEDSHPQLLAFPLHGGPFLCSQGENGQLSHFFSGNLHAIDLRCPIGTPLLAVGDGVVVESQTENTLTGIAVSNMFKWNSILLQLDASDGDVLFVEYVHIESSNVRKGQRVRVGEVIGKSGSVGFSPEPHLHFAAYRSGEANATTVRVRFQAENGTSFLPLAGMYYGSKGQEPNPSSPV